MQVFLNTVTGKQIVAKSLASIPGNIVYRGLSHEYVQLDTLAIEYARLVNQLQTLRKTNQSGICIPNTIKAIKDYYDFNSSSANGLPV